MAGGFGDGRDEAASRLRRVGVSRLRALDVPIGCSFERPAGGRMGPPGRLHGQHESQQNLDGGILGRRETTDMMHGFARVADAGGQRQVRELVCLLEGDPRH
jgi:hypothetical protein